jgi:translation initiation factor IF-2
VPEAGDSFLVMADASAAREIAQKRQRLEREAQHRRTGRVKTLEDFMAERADGGMASLRVIIKADQGGPAEALADALGQLSTAEVRVEVVHRGVGAITDSDVLLAKASARHRSTPARSARRQPAREGDPHLPHHLRSGG